MAIFNIFKNTKANTDITGEDKFQEGAGEYRKLVELTQKDDDLVKQIDADIKETKPLYDKVKAIQDENEKYYLGTQLDDSRFSYELPADQNILYRNLETMISIITSKRREPIVLPAQDTDESKQLAEKNQQFLSWKWDDDDLDIKLEDWIRHAYISRIGVLKIKWDKEKDDFTIQVKRPQRILIDKNATDEYDAKFIAELDSDTLGDLMNIYPKAKQKLVEKFGAGHLGTEINYIKYWTNEFVVCKVNDIILEKKKNPNWNWEETAEDRKKKLSKLKEKWTKQIKDKKLKNILINYFNEPRKPFIILSFKNLGKSIYAATTDFEQAKRGQDIVNRRKRQIDKAAIHALGRTVVSGSFITKDEAKKLIANPNAPLWLKAGNANDAITHVAPQPVSPVILQDLQDSKTEIDNEMGVHGTTRGEKGNQETATGRKVLREGDLGRLDLAVRRIDQKLNLLYAWMLQMAKVYYDDVHFTRILGAEGSATYLEFSQNDVEDGIEVLAKSEMSAFKAEKRQQADERIKNKLIDPLTYFEEYDEIAPKEKARRMSLYNFDPKLYMAQFLMDENTPGMENTPEGKAQQEQKQIMQGEQVPPYAKADKAHIEEHAKFMKSADFANLEDDQIRMAMTEHVRAEIEQIKNNTKGYARGNGAQTAPAGGQTPSYGQA